MMQLQDYDVATTYQATVLSSERISPPDSEHEVREITIEVQDPDFQAKVGQNLGVLAPGSEAFGHDHHFRLYGVADVPQTNSEGLQRFGICVRRCTYLDPYSGEEFPGIASNYLCDLGTNDTLTITGPYGQPFKFPANYNATLILISAGTGIAPFRAFVKSIYADQPGFAGRIMLFHGGQAGLDMLYRNDEKDDFAMYYDRETFDAINALSKRPGWNDDIDWETAIKSRAVELTKLLAEPTTYVYVAGVKEVLKELDAALAAVAGSLWSQWKAELESDGRWIELVY
ncbi:hypothetical protein [Rubripirellula obstinata]|nr:hypothetical protein [Rubripirellula obstinata]